MYSILLDFSVVSYSLVLPGSFSLSFWWTVPLFLLIYLCEVFLYVFIISFYLNLSTHFLNFFKKFSIYNLSSYIFSFYKYLSIIDS